MMMMMMSSLSQEYIAGDAHRETDITLGSD